MAKLQELQRQARAASEEKDYEKVIALCRQMLDQDADNVVALAEMANAYWHLGRVYQAENYVDKALQLDENYYLAWYNRGLIAFKREHYDEAARAFQRTVDLQPDFANGWNMLGLTRLHQRRLEEAEMNLLKALEIDPANEYARKNLVTVRSFR